jgi:hypothetical protein
MPAAGIVGRRSLNPKCLLQAFAARVSESCCLLHKFPNPKCLLLTKIEGLKGLGLNPKCLLLTKIEGLKCLGLNPKCLLLTSIVGRKRRATETIP